MNSYQIFHRILISEGFISVSRGDGIHRYEGNISVSGKVFSVEIAYTKCDFVELPIVRVLSWPEEIPKLLPHVEPNKKLCYLDHERVYLDRYDPVHSFHTILENVRRLLASYVSLDSEPLENDFSDEFTAYWGASSPLFLRSHAADACLSTFTRNSISTEREVTEFVIHSSDEQIDKWVASRNGETQTLKALKHKAITVRINSLPMIPVEGAWPPKSSEDVFNWLLERDKRAAQSLMSKVGEILKQNNRSMFVTLLTTSGAVGYLVKYGDLLQKRFKRSSKKSNKGLDVKTTLLSKLAGSGQEFTRYNIIDSTDKRICSRNQSDELSLIGKKIAVIGCGTVGGYAAKLLNQIGAGLSSSSAKGCLDIYDSDYLEPDNLGRHFLDAEYVHENKAKAMAHFLKSRSYSEEQNIRGYSDAMSPQAVGQLKCYDLVIDVTGNEQFSTSLNHCIHRGLDEVVVLYSWVDMGGKAVRALIDDFSGACYRCLRKGVGSNLEERFPLLAKNETPPEAISRECSSTYFTYASASSMACASLVQQLAADYFSSNPSPRFRHLSLTNDVLHTKHGNPQKLKGCVGCSI